MQPPLPSNVLVLDAHSGIGQWARDALTDVGFSCDVAAGVRVVMITGDHPATAARIAADLDIAPVGAPTASGAPTVPLSSA